MTECSRRILVTGGAGFLGSHLCETLLQAGHEVICIDNLYTGKYATIKQLERYRNFRFQCRDINYPFEIAGDIDNVFNFACPASPIHYQRDPIFTLRTNVVGSLNVLEFAARKGARILQASTSEVYGNPLVHPQTEGYCGNVNPIGIRACYDEGKRCAEALFFDYRRTRELSVRVARIFNTYGPRMDIADGRAVSNFVVLALRNEDITIFGDGSQTRSFCYCGDLIGAIIRLMDLENEIESPINIGNPSEVTVLELAELIRELTGSRSSLVFKPLPSDDPQKRKPDITQAKLHLDWQPVTRLRDGLSHTIAYYRKLLEEHSFGPSTSHAPALS